MQVVSHEDVNIRFDTFAGVADFAAYKHGTREAAKRYLQRAHGEILGQGKVVRVKEGEGRITADVAGSNGIETYNVTIEQHGLDWADTNCTCLSAKTCSAACKHVLAVLLLRLPPNELAAAQQQIQQMQQQQQQRQPAAARRQAPAPAAAAAAAARQAQPGPAAATQAAAGQQQHPKRRLPASISAPPPAPSAKRGGQAKKPAAPKKVEAVAPTAYLRPQRQAVLDLPLQCMQHHKGGLRSELSLPRSLVPMYRMSGLDMLALADEDLVAQCEAALAASGGPILPGVPKIHLKQEWRQQQPAVKQEQRQRQQQQQQHPVKQEEQKRPPPPLPQPAVKQELQPAALQQPAVIQEQPQLPADANAPAAATPAAILYELFPFLSDKALAPLPLPEAPLPAPGPANEQPAAEAAATAVDEIAAPTQSQAWGEIGDAALPSVAGAAPPPAPAANQATEPAAPPSTSAPPAYPSMDAPPAKLSLRARMARLTEASQANHA
eukprot:scaffold3.g6209.t1